MKSDYDWVAISRYVLGESSNEEKIAIEMKIKSDKDFEKLIREVRQVASIKQKPFEITNVELKWEEIKADLLEIPSEKTTNSSRSKVHYLNSRKKTQTNISNFWRYAAVILFTLGVSYFLSKEFIVPEATQEVEYKTLSVNSGERKTIVLYDGTTINLDSGSELKYPQKFGDTREVYLKGEGFFQVAKNPNKPFIIYSGNAQVQVLGTKFNVRSWAEDLEGVIVTVAEGKVSLGSKSKKKPEKVILTKNMQSSLSQNGEISDPVIVDAARYSQWMKNEIYFQKASLKQIVLQLQRWYNIQFEVEDDLLERENLTIHLKNKNINDILDLLTVMTDTKVERHGKKIYLTK